MRKKLLTIDWWLFTPMIVLLLVSLTTLLSLNVALFRLQLIDSLVALLIFFIFSHLRYEVFKQFALQIYIGSLVALGIVLLVGFESHGAVRWIQFLGGSIQFSEICKPLLVISLAAFLSHHENNQIKYFFLALIFLIPLLALLYLQPDLGDAIIYFVVTIFVLLVYGYKARWFLLGLIPLLIIIPVFWGRLHDYQRQRILSFLHPANDQSGASYNAMQALIAVGSGMFWGRGLSEGTQSVLRFLPERHTDFIFATLTEELGFVGGIIVITAFSLLLYRIYFLFSQSEDSYIRVFTSAAFALFLIHLFLNVGMNEGILPIVGVTLPFVSFGGSSLLANSMLLGLLTGMSRTDRGHEVLEIR